MAKTTYPIIKIVNCTTGEELEREMTPEEFAIYSAVDEVTSDEQASE